MFFRVLLFKLLPSRTMAVRRTLDAVMLVRVQRGQLEDFIGYFFVDVVVFLIAVTSNGLATVCKTV